jgi:hypothetical protein
MLGDMKIVKVFKTDVQDQPTSGHIIHLLQLAFSYYRINFDLDDCDRVLRIESHQEPIEESEIQLFIASCGYHCEPLQS